jgi:hypothetical protein
MNEHEQACQKNDSMSKRLQLGLQLGVATDCDVGHGNMWVLKPVL